MADQDERYRQDDGVGRDLLLDRAVELRAAAGAAADDLLAEARFLARLEHPSIPGVHDFVRGADGALLVGRPVEGITLAEAAARLAAGQPVPELATPAAVVVTMLKVCDAVAAAHARGVVHRALRPECVLLAWHGQVLVGDWRSALAGTERPQTRRFTAATARPAPTAPDGQQDDIRGIGACLFTALALHPPGPVGAAASARVPAALEAVARRALASDAATGYHSVEELSDDLARFLADGLPSAFRPGPLLRLRRRIEPHRRRLTVAAAALLLALLGGAALFGERLRGYATWGDPVIVEDFADDGWRGRWKEGALGTWQRQDGRLVTTAEQGAMLLCTRRLTTPVAIEYSGTIQPGSRPCDLSVVWTEHDAVLADPLGAAARTRSYYIQAGAYENSFCAIFTQPGNERVAHANVQLEPGRTHRFRVQIDGERFRQWIDGRLVLDHRELLPATSGHLALYGHFPGKAFDDVRIWQQPVPSTVPALAVGDAAYQSGRYDDAAECYARVAAAHADGALGQEARFRQGLAEHRQGQRERAAATWDALADPLLRHRADVLRLADLAAPGGWDRYLALFRQYWRERPAVREDLLTAWRRAAYANRQDPGVGERLLILRRELFPADAGSAYADAAILLGSGRYEEVLARHPAERRTCAQALLALGRTDELLAADWAISHEKGLAWWGRGELGRLAADPVQPTNWRALALAKLGRGEEALALPGVRAWEVLPHLGRAAEILADAASEPAVRQHALLALGRLDEGAAAGDHRALLLLGRLDEAEAVAKQPQPYHRMLAAFAAGQDDLARAWRAQVRPNSDQRNRTRWFVGTVALPLIDGGPADGLRRSLEAAAKTLAKAYSGRAAAVARAALGDESAWTGCELATEAEALRAIAAALRGELAGDRAAAQAGWRAFRALPMHRRLLDEHLPDLEIEVFAAWRASGAERQP